MMTTPNTTTGVLIREAAVAIAQAASQLAQLIITTQNEDAKPAPAPAPAAQPVAKLPKVAAAKQFTRATKATRTAVALERVIALGGRWLTITSTQFSPETKRRTESRRSSLLIMAKSRGVRIQTKVVVSASGYIRLDARLLEG
jgi:hypothetical protein